MKKPVICPGEKFNVFITKTLFCVLIVLVSDSQNLALQAQNLEISSLDRWRWSNGNGRGDLYIGDGLVGLSMGVALGGGGRGASRIWTKGGAEELFLGSEKFGEQLSLKNGRIGLNNADPGTEVDMSGQVRLRSLIHTDDSPRLVAVKPDGDLISIPPDTSYYSVNATAFRATNSSIDLDVNQQYARILSTGFQQMMAPVHLPHGAKVIGVTFWVLDNDETKNISTQLRYYDHITDTGFGPMTIGSTTNADANVQLVTDNTVFEPIVDNNQRNYVLWVFSDDWNSNFRIMSARITYVH